MADTVIRNIRFPSELLARMQSRAVKEERSVNYIVVRAVSIYLDSVQSNSDGIGAKVDRLSIPGVNRGVVRAVPKPVKRNGAKAVKVPMTGAEYQLDKDGTSGGRP